MRGTTTLVSTGPSSDGATANDFSTSTLRRTHADLQERDSLFETGTRVSVGAGCYRPLRRPASPTRPPEAPPRCGSRFVPAFLQCGTGANPTDGQHSPPLSAGLPAAPDAARTSLTSARSRPAPASSRSCPATPIRPPTRPTSRSPPSLTDSRHRGRRLQPNPTGPDLTLTARLRITDLSNCSPARLHRPLRAHRRHHHRPRLPGRGRLHRHRRPGRGGELRLNTSADAVMPGAAIEGQTGLRQAFRLRLNDSGTNGDAGRLRRSDLLDAGGLRAVIWSTVCQVGSADVPRCGRSDLRRPGAARAEGQAVDCSGQPDIRGLATS